MENIERMYEAEKQQVNDEYEVQHILYWVIFI